MKSFSRSCRISSWDATIIGAYGNVIFASRAECEGHPIKFWGFLKDDLLATPGSMVITMVYIWLRYLL